VIVLSDPGSGSTFTSPEGNSHHERGVNAAMAGRRAGRQRARIAAGQGHREGISEEITLT
jgi:hypothetical protein